MVEYTAIAGIGFEVNYKDNFRNEVLAKFNFTDVNLIDNFEHKDFRVAITGDYN